MLILDRLENVTQENGKAIAACPACREEGQDRAGNHLVIFDGGKFGCVRFHGKSPEAVDHRKSIVRLAGDGKSSGSERIETAPRTFLDLPPRPKKEKPIILGRFGRSSDTYMHTGVNELAASNAPLRVISAKQPSEASEDILEIAKRMFRVDAVWSDTSMDGATRDRLQLIEDILMLRDGKGRPAYTRTQIESCVIGLRPFLPDHPKNLEMMQRLRDAAKSAVSVAQLTDRMTKGHRA